MENTAETMHLLVIDDDETARSAIAQILTSSGYAIETAASGQEGLEAMERRRFDLVLLDIVMPGMSGIEAVARIRERERPGDVRVPVIALSVDDPVESGIIYGASGFDAFISKQLHLGGLVFVVSAYLSGGLQSPGLIPPRSSGL
jgi:CheY-like chemotaxis protein